jgi:exo-beta-1,3-glucanase (GH17 family)
LDLYAGLDVSEDEETFKTQLKQLMDSISVNSNADSAVLRGVVVGNEAVFRKEITVPALIGLVEQTHTALVPLETAIGRSIQVSAAEIFVVYLKNQNLIDAIDFLVPNMVTILFL